MIKNSERKKQKRQEEKQRKREAARWIAGLAEIVAVASDGAQRVLEGEEAVDAIIRQWEADGA